MILTELPSSACVGVDKQTEAQTDRYADTHTHRQTDTFRFSSVWAYADGSHKTVI